MNNSEEAAGPTEGFVKVEQPWIGDAAQKPKGVALDTECYDPHDESSGNPFGAEATVYGGGPQSMTGVIGEQIVCKRTEGTSQSSAVDNKDEYQSKQRFQKP